MVGHSRPIPARAPHPRHSLCLPPLLSHNPHVRARRGVLHIRLSRLLYSGAPVARSAVAGIGAGVGVGMGYTDCKHEFDTLDKEQSKA